MNRPAETALERIAGQLHENGVAALTRSFDSLLSSIEEKRRQLVGW